MAKAFDLVHKVSDGGEPEKDEPIPLDDSNDGDTPAPKKRFRVEIVFFYLLLFAVFFIMGAMFLSPGLFTAKKRVAKPSPIPKNTPIAGFTIDKQGQSNADAAKDLGLATPSPIVPNTSPNTNPIAIVEASPSAAEAAPATPTKAANIQVTNGTNVTGAAAAMRTKLANSGIVVSSISNYKKRTVAKTTVYYTADYRTAAQQVFAVTGGIMVQTTSTTTSGHDILVVLGKTH